MAKRGQKFVFHGAFSTKAAAKRRERARAGSFIKEARVRGKKRYIVMTPRKGR